MQKVTDEKLITNVGYNRDQMEIIMQVLLERGIRPENVTVPMIISIMDDKRIWEEARIKSELELSQTIKHGPNRAALRRCLNLGGTGYVAFNQCFIDGRFWLCRWYLREGGVIPGTGPGWRYDYLDEKVVREAERRWLQIPVHTRDSYCALLKDMQAWGFPLKGWDNHY